MQPVRTALIGCGKVGGIHAQALAMLPESQFVAVCDAQLARAEEFARRYNVSAFDSVERMLSEATPEAVTFFPQIACYWLQGAVAMNRPGSRALGQINAQPLRLDLDWVYCKRAKALGIPLVINPDAHSTGELALFTFGVNVARRAWLEKGDVFNTKSLKEVCKVLKIS